MLPRCLSASVLIVALIACGATAAIVRPTPTERELFKATLVVPYGVDFDVPDDAFGIALNGESVVRKGLKFAATGHISENAAVAISDRRLSVSLSDASVRTLRIGLERPVDAFGASFLLPSSGRLVTITVADRTFRLSDVLVPGGREPKFAAFVSDRPFDSVTFGFERGGGLDAGEPLVLDDFTFGNIPAPGAGFLALAATMGFVRRSRRPSAR